MPDIDHEELASAEIAQAEADRNIPERCAKHKQAMPCQMCEAIDDAIVESIKAEYARYLR